MLHFSKMMQFNPTIYTVDSDSFSHNENLQSDSLIPSEFCLNSKHLQIGAVISTQLFLAAPFQQHPTAQSRARCSAPCAPSTVAALSGPGRAQCLASIWLQHMHGVAEAPTGFPSLYLRYTAAAPLSIQHRDEFSTVPTPSKWICPRPTSSLLFLGQPRLNLAKCETAKLCKINQRHWTVEVQPNKTLGSLEPKITPKSWV